MIALVKKYPEKGLWIENVPEPEVGNLLLFSTKHKNKYCALYYPR